MYKYVCLMIAKKISFQPKIFIQKCAKIFKRTVRMAYQIMHISFPQTVQNLDCVL